MKSLMKVNQRIIERDWPNLALDNHSVESEQEPYNCIAWAAGKSDQPWWPISFPRGYYWPSGFDRIEKLENFVDVFCKHLGYEKCENGDLEDGYEKVAIYLDREEVQHMARQLASGKWTSKMGVGYEDIEHNNLDVLAGPLYGRAAIFLRRIRIV